MIVRASDFNSPGFEIVEPADDCFYCGEKLKGKAFVMWQGIGSSIWLHPNCALFLSDKLKLDFVNFKKGK